MYMRKILFFVCAMLTWLHTDVTAKTLVVYYSYTGNCRYALGTQLLNAIKANPNDASSYPAIDPVETSLDDYETIIIVTPLWWSQMAANMQTYLFNYGSQMAGKHIGLIVSSASSGISGVVDDCKRLVPDGNYFMPLTIIPLPASAKSKLQQQHPPASTT